MFTQDKDLRFTWVHNAPAGLVPELLCGKTDDEVLPPEAAQTIMAAKRKVMATEEPQELETNFELLGRKRSEEPYTAEDREVLQAIAASLGLVIAATPRETVGTDGFRECPSCGRCEVDLIDLTMRVEKAISGLKKPLHIAVMGCVVNGPGEALMTDLGFTGGGKGAAIGAGVGAGAGTGVAAATGKKDAKIESEALLTFVTLLFVSMILLDVSYQAFFNSFYEERASILYLTVLVPATAMAFKTASGWGWKVVFAAALALFPRYGEVGVGGGIAISGWVGATGCVIRVVTSSARSIQDAIGRLYVPREGGGLVQLANVARIENGPDGPELKAISPGTTLCSLLGPGRGFRRLLRVTVTAPASPPGRD